MSSQSGTAIPRMRDQGENSPAASFRTASEKNEQVSDLLKQMQGSLLQLGGLLSSVQDHSSRLVETGPRVSDALVEVNELKRNLKDLDEASDAKLAQMKRLIEENLLAETTYKELSTEEAKRLGGRMSISEQIRREIERQTKEQVRMQIAEHLPVSLETQAEDLRRERSRTQISYLNAEARIGNSLLTPNHIDDTPALYLTPSGEKGNFYPTSLRALLSYDDATVQELMVEYELPILQSREGNLSRFLHHIGCRFEIFQILLPNSPIGDAVGIRLA